MEIFQIVIGKKKMMEVRVSIPDTLNDIDQFMHTEGVIANENHDNANNEKLTS